MRIFFLISCLLLAGRTLAAPAPEPKPDEKSFDLAAGPAEFTLKSFCSQSGLEVVFATKTVAGTRTRAVKGRYRPIRAIDLMLVSTTLVATQYSPDGAVISPAPGVRPGKNPPAAD